MKINKQKIESIKQIINNIKGKVANNSKEKVPKKYYALLILMVMLAIMTLSSNINSYNKSKGQQYEEYKLQDNQVTSNNVQVKEYLKAESSISTNIATIEEETVETISKNEEYKYIMPIQGEMIKEFAQEKLVYSETLGMWKTHPGIDIKAQLGAEVKTASDGEVVKVYQDSFYGNTIEIQDTQGYTFIYSNLDDDIKVREGDKVKQKDVIGAVGVSALGELADITHLHFEVVKNKTQVNPQDLIN